MKRKSLTKPGDLVRDADTGDLGLVTSGLRSYGNSEARYIMVLWKTEKEPKGLDIAVIENGWIEVVE